MAAETSEPDVDRLASALRRHDEAPGADATITADSWKNLARWAFGTAGITVTDEEFAVAWRRLWQSATEGGDYRRDAERMLAAVQVVRRG